MRRGSSSRDKLRSFAVTSLGRGRWYWVVWPSAEERRAADAPGHIAQGYERTKAEAVNQGLEVAGSDAEWAAARYAREYHRQLHHKEGQAPALFEFLYRDVQSESEGAWHSVRHRVVRRTARYVYVEQQSFDPQRTPGGWERGAAPTYRLDREMLEREGYALVPPTADVDDPFFFTSPYVERAARFATEGWECLRVLGLSLPCTVDKVQAAYRELAKRKHPDRGGSHEEFLALRVAYEQALLLCRYGT